MALVLKSLSRLVPVLSRETGHGWHVPDRQVQRASKGVAKEGMHVPN